MLDNSTNLNVFPSFDYILTKSLSKCLDRDLRLFTIFVCFLCYLIISMKKRSIIYRIASYMSEICFLMISAIFSGTETASSSTSSFTGNHASPIGASNASVFFCQVLIPVVHLCLDLVNQSHLAIFDDSLGGRVISVDQLGPLPSCSVTVAFIKINLRLHLSVVNTTLFTNSWLPGVTHL